MMTILRAALVCAAAAFSMHATAAEPVKVGAVECLSGPAAKYGTMIRAGFKLAAKEINAKGGVLGGRPLTLKFEDSAGSKEQAMNAVRLLIGRYHVAALLGPTLSTEMFAAGPVANQRGIPIIGTSNTAKGITAIGPYVFRTSLPESQVVPRALKAAQAKFGFKRVAVLYGDDDAFTKSGYNVMAAALKAMGVTVVDTETFATKDTDFSAQLTRIKALHVDALVVSALAEAGGGLVRQARQLGLTMPIIGGNGFNSPKVIAIAGPAADGVVVGSPWFVGETDARNRAFVAAFRKTYGHDPDQFAAQAYDTLYILAAAFDRAGSTKPDALRKALLKTDYDGVLGPFTFTPNRDPASTDGVVVTIIKNGKFTLLK